MSASPFRKRPVFLMFVGGFCLSVFVAVTLNGQIAINAQSAPQESDAHQQLQSLARQASERFRMGDAAAAIKLEKEAIHVAEKHFGQYSVEASQVCMNLAVLLRATNSFNDAIAWMRQAADNYEQRKDTQATAYALTLQVLGETYLTTGESRLALQTLQRVYSVLSANLKETEPALMTAIHDLGVGYYDVGRMNEAEKFLLKALALRQEVIGKDSVPVAYTLDHLGKVCDAQRECDRAEAYFLEAARIFAEHESEVPDVAGHSCLSLAHTYLQTGRFAKAEEILQKAQAIFSKYPTQCGHSWIHFYRTVAEFRKVQDRLPEAEQALQKFLELSERANAQGGGVATACLELGTFYRDAGLISRAEDYLIRAKKVSAVATGENSVQFLAALRSLADLYFNFRQDAEKAVPYAKAASELGQRLTGHKVFQDELVYALVNGWLGNVSLERQILKSALEQVEGRGAAENAMYSLARLKLAQLDGEKADVLIEGSIQAELQRLGEVEKGDPSDPRTIRAEVEALREIGKFYLMGGQPRQARPYLERALPLVLEHVPISSDWYKDVLEYLAFSRLDLNEPEDLSLTEKWLAGRMARVNEMFSIPQHEDRQQWACKESPFDLPCSLVNPTVAGLISLRTKNIVLDFNEEYRRLARAAVSTQGATLWDKYVEANARYHSALLSPERGEDASVAKEAKDAAELELAKLTHTQLKVRESLSLSLDQLQKALPSDAAFLDYVAYSHRSCGGEYEMRYGIIVHRKGREPKLLDADATQGQLGYLVQLFRHAMGTPGKNPKEKNEALAELLKTMESILLGPVLTHLDGVNTLIISPDWELQTLPFAVLLDKEGRFLAERFRIQYVNSARDLLCTRAVGPSGAKSSIAIFGGAAYNLGIPAVNLGQLTSFQRARSLDLLADRSGLAFGELPGAARELLLISRMAREAGWSVSSFSGEDATELNFRERGPSARVLHVATHGYSFPRPVGKARQDTRRVHREPTHGSGIEINMDMDRYGLLFAGAQDSVSFWQSGYHMPEKNDGFLNAEEVEAMELGNTQLVVLSACNSGIGEAVPNGGVFNLRAAFLAAGAQNVISTLWPIPDAETADLMGEFYKRFFATGRVGASWQETQRDWLVKARKDKGLWVAIKQAGGFILGSSGWEN